MSEPHSQLRLVLETPSMELIALRSLLVLHCHGAVTVEDLRLLREVIPQLNGPNPRGFAILTILASASADLLDDAVRNEAIETSRVLRNITRLGAYVIEGQGFKRATIALALSTVSMLSGAGGSRRTFDSIDSAIEWLAESDPELERGGALSLRAALGAIGPAPRRATGSTYDTD